MFQYFTREEADLFTFYRIPKELFENPIYEDLSMGAKVLYGLLLDRNSLSRQNNWFDKDGYIFIYFSREEVSKKLKAAIDTITKWFAELRKAELVKEVKQGQGKPNIIYVGRFTLSTPEKSPQVIEKSQNPKISDSEILKNRVLQPENFGSNNTEKNYTEGGILTHTPLPPEKTELQKEKEKNVVCVDNTLTLKEEIRKITGFKVPEKKIKELLANTTMARFRYHLELWHIHKQHQKSEGAGWFFTVIENDIEPEQKKMTSWTGKENGSGNGKKPQRDNFEQRDYTREQCDKWEWAFMDEPSEPEQKNYTYVKDEKLKS